MTFYFGHQFALRQIARPRPSCCASASCHLNFHGVNLAVLIELERRSPSNPVSAQPAQPGDATVDRCRRYRAAYGARPTLALLRTTERVFAGEAWLITESNLKAINHLRQPSTRRARRPLTPNHNCDLEEDGPFTENHHIGNGRAATIQKCLKPRRSCGLLRTKRYRHHLVKHLPARELPVATSVRAHIQRPRCWMESHISR